MEHHVLGDGTRVALDGAGESRVWSPAPGVVATSMAGHGSMTLAAAIKRDCVAFMPPGSCSLLFSDWYEMTGYDTAARLDMTKWMAWMRPRISEFHLLVRSRLVAMGVSVANLALGGWVNSHNNRSAFDHALEVAIRRARQGHAAVR